METTFAHTSTQAASKGQLWTGRIIFILVTLFLLFDAIMKVIKESHSVQASAKLGWSENGVQGLGITLLISTILYIIPRTATLGAILITAYLGGAVCTMIQAGAPVYFPIIFGILVWTGLCLKDNSLRSHLPVKR